MSKICIGKLNTILDSNDNNTFATRSKLFGLHIGLFPDPNVMMRDHQTDIINQMELNSEVGFIIE